MRPAWSDRLEWSIDAYWADDALAAAKTAGTQLLVATVVFNIIVSSLVLGGTGVECPCSARYSYVSSLNVTNYTIDENLTAEVIVDNTGTVNFTLTGLVDTNYTETTYVQLNTSVGTSTNTEFVNVTETIVPPVLSYQRLTLTNGNTTLNPDVNFTRVMSYNDVNTSYLGNAANTGASTTLGHIHSSPVTVVTDWGNFALNSMTYRGEHTVRLTQHETGRWEVTGGTHSPTWWPAGNDTDTLQASESTLSLGWSCSTSHNGSVVACGDPEGGAVYVFEHTGDKAWAQSATLTGTGAVQFFGLSVDLTPDGSRLVVGSPDSAGQVFVFLRHANATWTEEAAGLTCTSLDAFSQLGVSVAIAADGRTVAAVASRHNSNNGALCLYHRPYGSTAWSEGAANPVEPPADILYFVSPNGHARITMDLPGRRIVVASSTSGGNITLLTYEADPASVSLLSRSDTILAADDGDEAEVGRWTQEYIFLGVAETNIQDLSNGGDFHIHEAAFNISGFSGGPNYGNGYGWTGMCDSNCTTVVAGFDHVNRESEFVVNFRTEPQTYTRLISNTHGPSAIEGLVGITTLMNADGSRVISGAMFAGYNQPFGTVYGGRIRVYDRTGENSWTTRAEFTCTGSLELDMCALVMNMDDAGETLVVHCGGDGTGYSYFCIHKRQPGGGWAQVGPNVPYPDDTVLEIDFQTRGAMGISGDGRVLAGLLYRTANTTYHTVVRYDLLSNGTISRVTIEDFPLLTTRLERNMTAVLTYDGSRMVSRSADFDTWLFGVVHVMAWDEGAQSYMPPTQNLFVPDTRLDGGRFGDGLGISMSSQGETLCVGDYLDGLSLNRYGAIYCYYYNPNDSLYYHLGGKLTMNQTETGTVSHCGKFLHVSRDARSMLVGCPFAQAVNHAYGYIERYGQLYLVH